MGGVLIWLTKTPFTASCKWGFDKRFDNRLYRANGVLRPIRTTRKYGPYIRAVFTIGSVMHGQCDDREESELKRNRGISEDYIGGLSDFVA